MFNPCPISLNLCHLLNSQKTGASAFPTQLKLHADTPQNFWRECESQDFSLFKFLRLLF